MQFFLSSPTKVYFEGEALAATLQSSNGTIEILPSHENIISTLEVGVVKITDTDGKEISFFVNGGSLSVQNNLVQVLTPVIFPLQSDQEAKEMIQEFSSKQEEINRTIEHALNQANEYQPTQQEEYLYAEERLDKIKLFQEILES